MYKHHVKFDSALFRVVLSAFLLATLLLMVTTPLYARNDPAPVVDAATKSSNAQQLEDRLSRLERKLDSQTLVELLTRMDEMQKELQRLAGDIEFINHEISGIKKRQRDLYVDLDRRIGQIEKAPVAAVPAGAGSASIAASAAGTGSDAAARKAYDKAFRYLKDRRYEKAVSEFQGFLRNYKNTSYANKAQYWLGEANYVQQNYIVALSEFTKVIARYPNSPKRPDAMLKMGYIYDTLGKQDKATKILKEVTSQFPDSTAARLAKKRLKNLNKK